PWREAMRILQAYEVWQTFGDVVGKHKPKFGPGVRERMEFASTVSKDAHDKAAAVRGKMVEHVMQTATAGTIMALPSAPSIAPRVDSTEPERDHFRTRGMSLTCLASMTGLPQISIPAGTVDGCPVGLSFIGWLGGDEELLYLAVPLACHCGMAA